MKTINKLVLTLFSVSLLFTSCAEQNVSDELQEVQMGTVDFSIQESTLNTQASKKGSKLAAKTNELADVTKAIITILTEDGSPTDFDNTELTVNRLNGELLVQKIALPIGNYQLTQFSFMDVNNDIIFTTPLAGSELADLVTNPLAIGFTIGNNAATPVEVEVVSTETYTPQDFGLVSFPITEIEKLDFLLAVSELGSNEILAGEYTVTATGFTTTKAFAAIEENVITVRDIENAVYTLTITKDGYENVSIDLTRDEIVNTYHTAPLVVELLKIVSIDGFTEAFSGINWTTSGVIARSFSDSTFSFDCGGGGGGVVAQITIPSDGTISFDWNIVIRSAGQYGDSINYIINGVSTNLSASGSASGSVIDIPVSAGDVFEFTTWGSTQSSSYYGSITNFIFTY
ncbi:hypothetical protein [Flavicella marina]|uniref:hypothetical protein n=1 Tax=Flavicella marina TaxID=1475951 RepID=UPI0012659294|nr:hypothetical protein [Flavicella marina]